MQKITFLVLASQGFHHPGIALEQQEQAALLFLILGEGKEPNSVYKHMKHKKWKDNILNSFEGVQQTTPDPFLLDKTWEALQEMKDIPYKLISMSVIRLMAACIVVLLCLNAYAF